MSILSSIMNAIFGKAEAADAPPAATAGAAPATPAATTTSASAGVSPPTAPAAAPMAAAAAPMAQVDVEAILTKLASENKEKLDWRKSIVDLMKLLKLDSSLAARKELAKDLSYTGDTNDSAKMNVWLHRQVMIKLAANGGKVPADLLKA
jgi:hypothetical protein